MDKLLMGEPPRFDQPQPRTNRQGRERSTRPETRKSQVSFGADPKLQRTQNAQRLSEKSSSKKLKKADSVTVDIKQALAPAEGQQQPVGQNPLQALYTLEKTRSSTRYKTDKTFRAKVEVYHKERQKFIKDVAEGQIQPEEIDAVSNGLGRQLAFLFDQIDENGNWYAEIETRIQAGGHDYANWSILANFLQQFPGIVRSTAILVLQATMLALEKEMKDSVPAQYMMTGINVVAVAAQIFTFWKVPLWQAQGQSGDVARRALHGPKDQANVSASVLVEDDGKTGKLLGTPFLESRIKMLRNLQGSMGREVWANLGTLVDEIEKLEDQVNAMIDPTKEHMNRSEARSYHTHRKLSDRLVALRSEAKFLTRLALDPKTDRAIDSEIANLEKKLAAERIFVKLSYQLNQAKSKNVRNLFNLTTAGVGLASSLSSVGGAVVGMGLQAATLASQVLQVISYRFAHGPKAGLDYKALLTAQFQVAALTGVGNLSPLGGPINPARLDIIMVGPIHRRVTFFKNVLEFDRSVYRAAILTSLSDVDGNMPNGSYQRSVVFFSNCKTAPERAAYVANAQVSASVEGRRQAGAILKLYEENEQHIKLLTEGKLDELLDDPSTLPDDAKGIFRGALQCAQDETQGHDQDMALAHLKGLTESLVDLAFVNQSGQKVGQNFLLVGAGPATPLAIKLITNAIQAVFYGANSLDYDRRKSIINIISAVGNSSSCVGTVVGFFVAYTAHKNISTKELQRGRDTAERGAGMPNASLLDYSLMDAIRDDQKPTGFKTLAAQPIPPDDSPDPVPYDRQATFLKDAWEQIMAPAPFLEMWKYLKLDPAEFNVRTAAEAKQLMDKYDTRLRELADGDSSEAHADEVRIDIALRAKDRTPQRSEESGKDALIKAYPLPSKQQKNKQPSIPRIRMSRVGHSSGRTSKATSRATSRSEIRTSRIGLTPRVNKLIDEISPEIDDNLVDALNARGLLEDPLFEDMSLDDGADIEGNEEADAFYVQLFSDAAAYLAPGSNPTTPRSGPVTPGRGFGSLLFGEEGVDAESSDVPEPSVERSQVASSVSDTASEVSASEPEIASRNFREDIFFNLGATDLELDTDFPFDTDRTPRKIWLLLEKMRSLLSKGREPDLSQLSDSDLAACGRLALAIHDQSSRPLRRTMQPIAEAILMEGEQRRDLAPIEAHYVSE